MQFKMSYSRAQQGAVPRGFGGPHKPSSKHVEGQVDPEDLTRRLLMVLAEQEAHEKRRQRRAAEQHSRHQREHESSRHGQSSRTHPDPRPSDQDRRRPSQADISTSSHRSSQHPETQSTEHHYVPKEAARQFTRTTTVEQMRSNDFIHQLSKRAHKHHHEGGPASSTTPADLARQLRHSQAERDRAIARERQQRQQQAGPSTSSTSQQNHTFKAELARLNTNHNRASLTGHYNAHHHPRRNSTGGTAPLASPPAVHQPTTRRSMLILNPTLPEGSDTSTPTTSDEPTPIHRFPAHAPEHRVDWSQSDERKPLPPQPIQQPQHHHSLPKLLLSPLLKRADSLFTLRSKSKEKEGVDRGNSGEGTSASAVTSPLATHHEENPMSTGPGTMLPSPTRAARSELPPLSVPVARGESNNTKSPSSAKSPGSGGKGFFGRFKR
ncbi:hypothetical protein QBC40DRAFT_321364 [Triangularia verruculosa]|uniref:Uncharacterized protein n=1 Tax=Triangularia verruculosa TaxID=2587418 RepID=A0AAN7AXX5_9PEZI|nr:hypothetical protein QBC40DRAFT_321364 [Triangularia verruculosa]